MAFFITTCGGNNVIPFEADAADGSIRFGGRVLMMNDVPKDSVLYSGVEVVNGEVVRASVVNSWDVVKAKKSSF